MQIVSDDKLVSFTYADSTTFGEKGITITCGAGLASAYHNDTPTLQSIGEALIPALNEATDPSADFSLILIIKLCNPTEVPIV